MVQWLNARRGEFRRYARSHVAGRVPAGALRFALARCLLLSAVTVAVVCPGGVRAADDPQYCNLETQWNCTKLCVDGHGGIKVGDWEVSGDYSWKVSPNAVWIATCKPSSDDNHVCCKDTPICGTEKYYVATGCPGSPAYTRPYSSSRCYRTWNKEWGACPDP